MRGGVLRRKFMKRNLTLVFIEKDGEILLGMKKRGFGAGRWNGFGGKLQAGETLEEAAGRETEEEVGIAPRSLEKRGVLEFEFEGNSEILEVHVFKAGEWTGEPRETEEMWPEWFKISEIPYDDMWADDKIWLPLFLDGKKFKGWFSFNENDQVLEHKLEIHS